MNQANRVYVKYGHITYKRRTRICLFAQNTDEFIQSKGTHREKGKKIDKMQKSDDHK